jgi:hypothetical protein
MSLGLGIAKRLTLWAETSHNSERHLDGGSWSTNNLRVMKASIWCLTCEYKGSPVNKASAFSKSEPLFPDSRKVSEEEDPCPAGLDLSSWRE